MKTNFIIYLIKPGISICPERNLNPLSFAMYLRKYHHPPPPLCHHHYNHAQKCENSHKNMVQQEKLPSMFAGSTGVELKSERRIEKISMAYNGVLTPQTKITFLKLLKYPHKLGEFLILLNSVGGMGARVHG